MKELTKGFPAKVIVLFALPIMFGNIFQQLYNITDSKIVSLYVNSEALAAVGATTVLTNMMVGFVNGLTQGYSISVARCFGARDMKALRKHVAGEIMLTFLFAIPIAVCGIVFLVPFLKFLNTPSDILANATMYARIILFGMVFASLYNMSSNILRAVGDSRTPLICLIIAVLLNIPLDLLFICVFRMGIKGTAFATIMAQAVSSISCTLFLILRYKEVLPKKDDWKVEKVIWGDMLPAGVSMGMMGCLVNIGSLILQSAINGLGTSVLTAHTAGRRLFDIMMVMIYSIGFAMTTYSSQNLGAGKGSRVKQGIRHAILIDTGITTLLIILCFIFGRPIIRWIASTNDTNIINNGVMYIRVGVIFFYVLGPLFILRCSLQGLGHRIIPLISSCLELLTKLLFAFIMVPALKYFGVALTEPVSWVIMTIPLIVVYAKSRKELTDITEDNEVSAS